MDNLDKLKNSLKPDKIPTVKIGILGASGRSDSSETNADIGAKHEFGMDGMPQRSFLRMPLTTQLEKQIEKSGLFNEDAIKEMIRTGSAVSLMKKVAICAEAVVQEAFATGGYSQWPAHAPGYTNETGEILINTTQLRNSISSVVE